MINIRKEQKIAIPQEYLEYLNPDYVFIPIKENKNYPKTLVKRDDLIEDIKVPITGNILATAVNNDKRYLIIKNSHLDDADKDNENLDEIEVSKNDDKKEEVIESLENLKDKETIYINAFDKDVLAFNNYYLLLKEKDKVIFTLNYLIENTNVKEIYLVIPATYEETINQYRKIKNKKIKLIILNDYFALGYNDILSKYLRVNSNNIISIRTLFTTYYAIKNKNNNYIYLTINGNIKAAVIKVTKYTILKELLENLKIDTNDIEICLNNSLISKKIDIQHVINEDTKLIIVNKKDKVLESKKRKDNCSNCGLCYTLCPWHINPLKTNNCYNCGLCNYVCPSKRVLRVGDSDV